MVEASSRIETLAAECFADCLEVYREAEQLTKAFEGSEGTSTFDPLEPRFEYRLAVFELCTDYLRTLDRVAGNEPNDSGKWLSDAVQDAARRAVRRSEGAASGSLGGNVNDELSLLGIAARTLGDLYLEGKRRTALIESMAEANEPLAQIANTFASDERALLAIFDLTVDGSTADAIKQTFQKLRSPSSGERAADWQQLEVRIAYELRRAEWNRRCESVATRIRQLTVALTELAAAHDEAFRALSSPGAPAEWTSLVRLIEATREKYDL